MHFQRLHLAFALGILLINSCMAQDALIISGREYTSDAQGLYLQKDHNIIARVHPGFVVVRLKNDVKLSAEQLNRLLGDTTSAYYYTTIAGVYPVFRILDEEKLLSIAQSLERNTLIDEVCLDVYFQTCVGYPNDTHHEAQWHLQKIAAYDAWELCTGDTNIVTAVIDCDAEYNHSDLLKNRNSFIGYDFVDNDYDPINSRHYKHATAVAGLIAADTDNDAGVCGIAGGWGSVGGIRLMYFQTTGIVPDLSTEYMPRWQ